MRIALDTNVISAYWIGGPAGSDVDSPLMTALGEGSVVISGIVYVELQGHPTMPRNRIDQFLERAGIYVDFDFTPEIWQAAGEAYAGYVKRRRASSGGTSKRMLADFLIGAHALHAADRLLTLDRERYAAAFPTLAIAP